MKKRPTIADHQRYGVLIKKIRADLLHLEIELSTKLPHHSEEVRYAGKAFKDIEILRSVLEERLFDDHPKATTHVYYGNEPS